MVKSVTPNNAQKAFRDAAENNKAEATRIRQEFLDALDETTANAEEIDTEAGDGAVGNQIDVDNFGDPVVVIDTDQNIWERHTYA